MGDEEKKEKKKKSKKKAEEPPPEAAPAEPPPPAPEPEPAPAAEPEPAPEAAPEPEPEPEPEIEHVPIVAQAPSVGRTSKKRAQRTTSNVFAMFSQNKIQEFKEAFSLIDQDKDGIISKMDLKLSFESLGKIVGDEDLETMLAEAPGNINFTWFLTIFGDKIAGTDDEDVIYKAFRTFDTSGEGRVKEYEMRHSLMAKGERFTEEEANEIMAEAPVDDNGYISLKRFAHIIMKGEDEPVVS